MGREPQPAITSRCVKASFFRDLRQHDLGARAGAVGVVDESAGLLVVDDAVVPVVGMRAFEEGVLVQVPGLQLEEADFDSLIVSSRTEKSLNEFGRVGAAA